MMILLVVFMLLIVKLLNYSLRLFKGFWDGKCVFVLFLRIYQQSSVELRKLEYTSKAQYNPL